MRTRSRRGAAGRAGDALARPWQARGRVIVVLDPDAVPAARLAGALRRRPVVVDVHEDYAALAGDRSWSSGAAAPLVRGALAGVTRLARGADLTVVADDQVPPFSARQRLVVRNLPDTSMLPGPSPRDPAPRALYVGDVRRSRGLFAMLDALEAAPSWTLDVVGPVAAADQPDLDAWLASLDAPAAERFDRSVQRMAVLTDRYATQLAEMPAEAYVSIKRREWRERADLYDRLSFEVITLPPLRARAYELADRLRFDAGESWQPVVLGRARR